MAPAIFKKGREEDKYDKDQWGKALGLILVHIYVPLRQHAFHFNAALKKIVPKVKMVQLWAHQLLNCKLSLRRMYYIYYCNRISCINKILLFV